MKNQNRGIAGYLIMLGAAVLTFLFIVSCGTHEICGEYVGVKGRYVLLKVNPDSEKTTEVRYNIDEMEGVQFGDYICLEL